MRAIKFYIQYLLIEYTNEYILMYNFFDASKNRLMHNRLSLRVSILRKVLIRDRLTIVLLVIE